MLLALRFSLAAALFPLFFPGTLSRLSRAAVVQGGWLGLWLFFGFALQTVGLRHTTASKSAFLTGLMVLFTPLIYFLWKRRDSRGLTPANLAGIGLVVGGLWLLTDPRGGLNVGDGLTLLCAVSFGAFIVYLDEISRRHDVATLTFLQIAWTAGFSWIGVALFERSPLFNPTWVGVGVVVYLTLAATILTGYVMTRWQKETTPVRAVIIYTIEPVWTALMAAALLSERLTAPAMIGGGLILAGILVSEMMGNAKTERS